ncbi:MAG: hypothetical protein HW407_619 [Bacteroidetes bacterium]|nr:hypothetical protein [Bacteroidota bacterium]
MADGNPALPLRNQRYSKVIILALSSFVVSSEGFYRFAGACGFP